jgi:hypothetical protein
MRGLDRIAADRRHLVAAQVRCSTGFTWGRAVEGRAVVGVPRHGASLSPMMPADLPPRLMAWLAARSTAVWLPPEAALPRLLGIEGPFASQHLAVAWAQLGVTHLVQVKRGRGDAWPGEWLVAATGRVHRSVGAPMAWAEAVA